MADKKPIAEIAEVLDRLHLEYEELQNQADDMSDGPADPVETRKVLRRMESEMRDVRERILDAATELFWAINKEVI